MNGKGRDEDSDGSSEEEENRKLVEKELGPSYDDEVVNLFKQSESHTGRNAMDRNKNLRSVSREPREFRRHRDVLLYQTAESEPTIGNSDLDNDCECDERCEPGYYDRKVVSETCECGVVEKKPSPPLVQEPPPEVEHPQVFCQTPAIFSNVLGPTLDTTLINNLNMITSLIRGNPFGDRENLAQLEEKESKKENLLKFKVDSLTDKVKELSGKKEELEKLLKLDEEERELKRQAFQEEQSRLLNLVEKSSIAARTAKEQECSAKMMLQDRYRCVEEEDKRMCEEINRKWKEEECRRKRYVEELCRTAEEEERRLEIIRNEYKQCSCLLEKIKTALSLTEAWQNVATKCCHTKIPSYEKLANFERSFSHFQKRQSSMQQGKGQCNARGDVTDQHPPGGCRCCKDKPPTCGFHVQQLCAAAQPYSTCHDRERKTKSVTCCQSPKIVKVMWAVARINVFEEGTRTYEIMDPTNCPPPKVPNKTEGVFIVNNKNKKAQGEC